MHQGELIVREPASFARSALMKAEGHAYWFHEGAVPYPARLATGFIQSTPDLVVSKSALSRISVSILMLTPALVVSSLILTPTVYCYLSGYTRLLASIAMPLL
jgi:hypothetical protein